MTYDNLTKFEERFIQYTKLVLGVVMLVMLYYFTTSHEIIFICR